MLNITINAPRAFTTVELQILRASFEKLSQLTTMYTESGLLEPMEQYVRITKEDVDLSNVLDDGDQPALSCLTFSTQDFIDTFVLALHTIVSFSVDTKNGIQTMTSPLFPCILNSSGWVAWNEEPDFIIRLDKHNRIKFECFDSLTQLSEQDVDGAAMKITMRVGGNEIWSM